MVDPSSVSEAEVAWNVRIAQTIEEILFESRINPNPKHKLVKDNLLLIPLETETLLIKKELIVQLINRNGKVIKNIFRYIYAEQKDTGEPIAFITNIAHLDVLEITNE